MKQNVISLFTSICLAKQAKFCKTIFIVCLDPCFTKQKRIQIGAITHLMCYSYMLHFFVIANLLKTGIRKMKRIFLTLFSWKNVGRKQSSVYDMDNFICTFLR
jgi:hypothetical protein